MGGWEGMWGGGGFGSGEAFWQGGKGRLVVQIGGIFGCGDWAGDWDVVLAA